MCRHTKKDVKQNDAPRYKSHLTDPYSTAHRAHASKVCCAASAVVEGRISTIMKEDRHEKETNNKRVTEDYTY